MFGFTATAGGQGYVDIRVGDGHGIHEGLIDVSTLGAADDAEGYLPPGLPLTAAGDPVGSGESAYGVIGPEPVKMGAADHFGNMIMTGILNRDAIEDNLGRVLSADELAGIASGCPGIKLI
jgi:hypothetical protein